MSSVELEVDHGGFDKEKRGGFDKERRERWVPDSLFSERMNTSVLDNVE